MFLQKKTASTGSSPQRFFKTVNLDGSEYKQSAPLRSTGKVSNYLQNPKVLKNKARAAPSEATSVSQKAGYSVRILIQHQWQAGGEKMLAIKLPAHAKIGFDGSLKEQGENGRRWVMGGGGEIPLAIHWCKRVPTHSFIYGGKGVPYCLRDPEQQG